jgi:hypothetical protein
LAVVECGRALKKDNPAKHFIIPLVIAVLIYVVSYSWIENRRHRNGPWVIAFTNSIAGTPTLLINQPKVGVTNVQLVFPGGQLPKTNWAVTIVFEKPREVPFDLPFGKCIFMDATFLPGTLTFQIFGHEIELLPRVMILDHQEHPWRTGEVISLEAAASPLP